VPTVIIIAGPNGAGKTTFGDRYLSREDRRFEFVNADEFARGLDAHEAQPSDISAGRLMLARVDELVRVNADFAIETTLATLIYARRIPVWRGKSYVVSLTYLRLSSVEESIDRVRRRVAAGGHGIPEETIRRRFAKSRQYFEAVYKPLVDEWYLWDSREGVFEFVESGNGPER
jgi:predicted ABC-type ATPase